MNKEQKNQIAQEILASLEKEESGSWVKYGGVHKGYEFDLENDPDQFSDDWYIQVIHPNGMYDYDGFWRDSEDKEVLEVIIQACDGALIWERIK